MRFKLAVIIPAYKAEYLDATLRSLANQTNKMFTCYIGDDASPHQLKYICDKWKDKVKIHYHRFDNNIGGHDLVSQWTRCLALSSEEPWIWLFSDDDLLDPGCIEQFYLEQERYSHTYSLYHFNVRVIDKFGEVISEAPLFPELLSAESFASNRLDGKLSSFATEYVFHRDAYNLVNGFQNFPRGWCSDDATWIKLASTNGIKTIFGPKVNWRFSGHNISSNHSTDRLEKLEAAIQFVEWLTKYIESTHNMTDSASVRKIYFLGRWWLNAQANTLGAYFWKLGLLRTARRLRKTIGGSESIALEAMRLITQDIRLLLNKFRH